MYTWNDTFVGKWKYILIFKFSAHDMELKPMLVICLGRWLVPKAKTEKVLCTEGEVCSRGFLVFLHMVVKWAGVYFLIPLSKSSFLQKKKKKILQGLIIWLTAQTYHWILGDIMKRPSFCSKQIATAVMIIVIIMSIINRWQCILLALGAWAIWQTACCTLSHNNDIHCQPRKFT